MKYTQFRSFPGKQDKESTNCGMKRTKKVVIKFNSSSGHNTYNAWLFGEIFSIIYCMKFYWKYLILPTRLDELFESSDFIAKYNDFI